MGPTDLYNTIPYLETVVKETGYETLNSLWFLNRLVRNIAPNRVIELGTGYGCSTIFMASALRQSEMVISVDDYRGDTSESIEKTQRNIDQCHMTERVELIEGDSRQLIKIDEKAEMVFMDASHNPNDLYAELSALQLNLCHDYVLVIDDIFSVHLDEFTFNLLKNKMYPFATIVNFHNGMAIFCTCPELYAVPISAAIKEACNV